MSLQQNAESQTGAGLASTNELKTELRKKCASPARSAALESKRAHGVHFLHTDKDVGVASYFFG